jgi:type III pantothenate kinase
MLLVIDVGNTNTVLGVFADTELRAHWRLTTKREQTADEYGILIRDLFDFGGLGHGDITGIMIASVVPPLNWLLEEMAQKYFGLKALFLGPGTRTGMAIHYDNPQEVGADRIANGVAAYEKYGGPCVVVDFGTAITFDAISKKGEYLGGVICPGLGVSADALFARAARLPRVEIREPDRVIGTNTVASIQSGLFYGAVGLLDGVLDRLVAVLGRETRVIATGGQASLVAAASRYKPPVDAWLTLDGLRMIYDRNMTPAQGASGRGPKSIPHDRKPMAPSNPVRSRV